MSCISIASLANNKSIVGFICTGLLITRLSKLASLRSGRNQRLIKEVYRSINQARLGFHDSLNLTTLVVKAKPTVSATKGGEGISCFYGALFTLSRTISKDFLLLRL